MWRGGYHQNVRYEGWRGGSLTPLIPKGVKDLAADAYVISDHVQVTADALVQVPTTCSLVGDGYITVPLEVLADALVASSGRVFPMKANPSGRSFPVVP